MSVLSSGDEYTEDELLQVCEEMGLPFDSENIGILKQAIDELIAESNFESEEGFLDASLFGSLSLTNSSQSSQKSSVFVSQENVSSPIQRLGRRSSKPGCGYSRPTKEVPLEVPTSQENEEMKRHNPAAYFLLNDAWRCLSDVYGTMAAVEDLQIRLSSWRPAKYVGARFKPHDVPRHFLKQTGEDKENKVASRCHGGGTQHSRKRFTSPIRSNGDEQVDEPCSPEKLLQPDPSLRPVEQFEPGKLLYRHDPVKKFELYREEWARRPAPGEEKRLALRWKVREYMLRQDLPDFDPRRPVRLYATHPKDWSPRPYLD